VWRARQSANTALRANVSALRVLRKATNPMSVPMGNGGGRRGMGALL